jgi:hypothetical protein
LNSNGQCDTVTEDKNGNGVCEAFDCMGPKGETGPEGQQGPKGDTGSKGDKGDTGSQGLKGDIGAKGDKGDQGLQGNPGVPGVPGPQGLAGPGIIGGGSSKEVTDGVKYIAAFFGDFSSNESDVGQVLPVSGTLSQLNVRLNGRPGNGKSYVFIVMKNGNPTIVTCAISGVSIGCADTTNSEAFAAGDTISLQSTAISDPADRVVRWTAKFQ